MTKRASGSGIKKQQFVEAIVEAMRKAIVFGSDANRMEIEKQSNEETSELAKFQLNQMLQNFKVARKHQIPLCQDTGVPVFYARVGSKFKLNFDLREALDEAVRKATKQIPLRANIVHPISRENSGNNCGLGFPFVFFDFFNGNYLEIVFYPKGGGSENMSRLRMFEPTAPIEEVKRFIVETAAEWAGKCCPPCTLGIGIGGGADICLNLAKKATLREQGERNKDKKIAEMERELLEKINSLGIGPMGLGGKHSALAVNIEIAGAHTATLPVGIANNCWPGRKAKARFYNNGKTKIN